jgi:glycosyltransferase involved in cell wall biosynthesis
VVAVRRFSGALGIGSLAHLLLVHQAKVSAVPASDEPIRILRVIARLNMGGPAIHVSNLAAGLEPRGYETTLVAGTLARGEDSMAFLADRLGIRVLTVPELQREVSPVHDARSIRQMTSIIRELRPHILHTHTAKAGAIARAAALVAGDARPPVVVHTFHGHVLKGYFDPLRTRVFKQVEKSLARTTDALIAVSPEVRDELVAAGIAPLEKFTVIRLGIPLEERLGDASADLDYRKLYGIPEDAFVVGWVGRMTAVKDTDAVLEIVRAARARGVDAVLVMVGDGPDRDRLEELAHALGIARSTFFVGYQAEVAGFYRLFDAFLLPSVNEGTPVSAIEALASGTPVVATRVGGVPDVVRDGEDGFLFEPGDVDSAATRLVELASDPSLREAFGQSGRARVLERYSVARLVDDVDRLYRSQLVAKGVYS